MNYLLEASFEASGTTSSDLRCQKCLIRWRKALKLGLGQCPMLRQARGEHVAYYFKTDVNLCQVIQSVVMQSSSNSKWAAYFGGATVVASLLLVAWEIRQNTVALSAQALQDLNVMANDILLTAAQSDQLSEVLVKGDADLASLSAGEARQYWTYSYGLINSLDAAHGFYQRGILNEEDYSGWRAYTCRYLQAPSIQMIWEQDKHTFGSDFSAFVSEECSL